MSRHQTDPAATPRRTSRAHDVHDIRALTDTGAIRIPGREGTKQARPRPEARGTD